MEKASDAWLNVAEIEEEVSLGYTRSSTLIRQLLWRSAVDDS